MAKSGFDMEYLGRVFTVAVFSILSVAGFGFSIYLFMAAHTAFIFVIAVSFLLLSILSGTFNILASYWYFKSFNYERYVDSVFAGLAPMRKFPTVSVVVPTHDEETSMIRENITELNRMVYQKGRMNIYILNDSSDKKKRRAAERLSKELGVGFVYTANNKAYKAGSLNNFLKQTKDEFIAIFDSDEYLTNKNFLIETIPYFQDRSIAYVQTEKRYRNGTFFSNSVDIFDAFFFKFIETARAMDGTAIFSGSCGVVRRSVLDEVGGFPEYAIEDTFFSLESDLRGYKGFYLPRVYALGKPISTFSKLVKQQWRYNYGDTQFISYFFKKRGHRKKSWFPALNYMAHGFGLNYLSVVLIFFTILSTAIVFSSLPFAHITISLFSVTHLTGLQIAETLGLFAFLLSMFAPAILTKIYFKSFRKGVMVFLLNYALAFVRAKAAIVAIIDRQKKFRWITTASAPSSRSGLIYALGRTKVEMGFVAILVALGILALSKLNISGGVWLIWYGFMYSLATVFFYKYG